MPTAVDAATAVVAAPNLRTRARAGFSWKGQTPAITQLLGVLVGCAADPSAELGALVADALAAMPDKVPAREQLAPVGGFAALCAATFNTWYK
jgi:hypothetical protein